MHVHEHAGREAREDLQEFVDDVAADGGHVRRVDEEHVAGFERRELVERDVLDR